MDTSLMDTPAAFTDHQLDRALAVFQAERPRLFRIAHRILGSVTETEDVMQDVWLRWQRADRQGVENPSAFLATMSSRTAINVVQSARSRHESTTASSLEGLVDVASDPTTRMEHTETVEIVVRVLLERTGPAERAAYLLRQGFGYPYRRIAEVLHLGVANTRQLVRRAHLRIHTTTRTVAVDRHAHRRLVRAFVTAAHDGDVAKLEAVLAADVRRGTRRGASAARRGCEARRPTASAARDMAYSRSLPAAQTSRMSPAIS